MQGNEVSVEANLIVKKSKIKTEKRVTINEEKFTSSQRNLDTLIKTMEKIMEKLEENKNPLQILDEYNALKTNPNEFVQYFTAIFNRIYDSIPENIKAPPGLALLHYPDGFNPNMSYQLREINLLTLE